VRACVGRADALPRCCANQAQGGARAGTYAYRGPFDALSTIVRKVRRRTPCVACFALRCLVAFVHQEGWRTLFKGFSTVLPVAPAQALYMGGYQGFRRLQPGDPDSPAVQFGALLALRCMLPRSRAAAVGGVVATLTQSIAMVPLEARPASR
jgi:hypothetical protein